MRPSRKNDKKQLLPEQPKEIFGILKARFEKNMNRHQGLAWAEVQARLKTNAEKLWSLSEMKELAANPMLLVVTSRRANTFFMIVQSKALKDAEVFATTVRRGNRGKKPNQKTMLLVWRLPWASSF